MTKEITEVTVDKISLLSSDKDPAVEKASTKYAIMKSGNSIIKKAVQIYNKLTLTKQHKSDLDQIINRSNQK